MMIKVNAAYELACDKFNRKAREDARPRESKEQESKQQELKKGESRISFFAGN